MFIQGASHTQLLLCKCVTLINRPVNFRLPVLWVFLQRPLLGIFKRAPTGRKSFCTEITDKRQEYETNTHYK